MIKLSLAQSYQCPPEDVFGRIDSIEKLLAIKKHVKRHRIARSEAGLQIVDASVRTLIGSVESRMKYTTRPEKYTELKQISGGFREFECRYSLKDAGTSTELRIDVMIRFRYWPYGFLKSVFLKPLFAARTRRELRSIGKIIRELKTQ